MILRPCCLGMKGPQKQIEQMKLTALFILVLEFVYLWRSILQQICLIDQTHHFAFASEESNSAKKWLEQVILRLFLGSWENPIWVRHSTKSWESKTPRALQHFQGERCLTCWCWWPCLGVSVSCSVVRMVGHDWGPYRRRHSCGAIIW